MLGRLLITGGTGTLGSHAVRMALKSGVWSEIHATYRTSNPNFHKVFWHYADARNLILPTLNKIQPQCIIHTLAMTSPDECEKRKLDAWQINVKTVDEIIDYCNAHETRLIYTSTDQIFDGEKGNYGVEDLPHPINFYGDSKWEAENEISENLITKNHVIARIGLMYGFNLNQRTNFFDAIYLALKNQTSVPLYSDQFRSMISVANTAECLLELAQGNYNGILHVAGPERISRYDFGVRMAKHLKLSDKPLSKVKMADVKTHAKRPADVTFDISLTRTILKTPLLGISEGLREIFP
jgi:dTDP-4-dehydrorhamnose reductase